MWITKKLIHETHFKKKADPFKKKSGPLQKNRSQPHKPKPPKSKSVKSVYAKGKQAKTTLKP
jgi:hypothetical protein